MTSKRLRYTLLIVLCALIINSSFAQSNYFKWSAGFGVGPNFSKTDVEKGNWGHTAYGEVNHYLTPFVSLGVEAQYGLVQGGNIRTDQHNRQFVNEYSSISLNFKMALGELIDFESSRFLDNIKGTYVGMGVGVIRNNITDIVRYKPLWASYDPGFGPFPGENKTNNLLVPLNLGYNYYLYDGYGYIRYAINLNFQSNFTFGEGLDGYDDPSTKFKNYSPDTYNAYTIGFKYFFGNTRAYHKTL